MLLAVAPDLAPGLPWTVIPLLEAWVPEAPSPVLVAEGGVPCFLQGLLLPGTALSGAQSSTLLPGTNPQVKRQSGLVYSAVPYT